MSAVLTDRELSLVGQFCKVCGGVPILHNILLPQFCQKFEYLLEDRGDLVISSMLNFVTHFVSP